MSKISQIIPDAPLTRNELSQAGYVLYISHATIKRALAELLALIEFHRDLIDKGVPYSVMYEDELHMKVISYIDLCILNINHLLKARVIKRQKFPVAHALLRAYRNNYHHESNRERFKPIDWYEKDTDFYIWPILSFMQGVKDTLPKWSKDANLVTLPELLLQNQHYIDRLFSNLHLALEKNGVKIKIADTGYHNATMLIGAKSKIIPKVESWKLS